MKYLIKIILLIKFGFIYCQLEYFLKSNKKTIENYDILPPSSSSSFIKILNFYFKNYFWHILCSILSLSFLLVVTCLVLFRLINISKRGLRYIYIYVYISKNV